MDRTWMPTVAGILNIISGVFSLIAGLGIALASGILLVRGSGFIGIPNVLQIPFNLLAVIAIPLILVGILALVGGIFALRRKIWGLALAGSMCALFPPTALLGIPAIIFTVLSQEEFK